jgi:hypothetical protein
MTGIGCSFRSLNQANIKYKRCCYGRLSVWDNIKIDSKELFFEYVCGIKVTQDKIQQRALVNKEIIFGSVCGRVFLERKRGY